MICARVLNCVDGVNIALLQKAIERQRSFFREREHTDGGVAQPAEAIWSGSSLPQLPRLLFDGQGGFLEQLKAKVSQSDVENLRSLKSYWIMYWLQCLDVIFLPRLPASKHSTPTACLWDNLVSLYDADQHLFLFFSVRPGSANVYIYQKMNKVLLEKNRKVWERDWK